MSLRDGLSLAIAIGALLLFGALGVAHIVRPDRFVKGRRRGGELLTEWNRLGIQAFGVIAVVASAYLAWKIFSN
jgi:hypothetical protein